MPFFSATETHAGLLRKIGGPSRKLPEVQDIICPDAYEGVACDAMRVSSPRLVTLLHRSSISVTYFFLFFFVVTEHDPSSNLLV